MNRIFDFSERITSLHVKNQQLAITDSDGIERTTPLSEIAVVILSGWQINLTKAVLAGLAIAGATLIVCDQSKTPVAMMVSLGDHHLQGRYALEQAHASPALQKRLWKQIVCAKIHAQGKLLKNLFRDDFGLFLMENQVKLGDLTNIEGRAARRYWSKLFAGVDFKRDTDGEDSINGALNYGYAVLRSLIARAIVGSGLNPALGLFHHNKYNAFCLADDLMEPFRPAVDKIAWELNQFGQLSEGITTPVKRALIEQITGRYIIGNRQETIFEASSRITASLAAAFVGTRKDLCLPSICDSVR